MASLPRPLLGLSAGLLAVTVLTSCGSDASNDDTNASDPSESTSIEASDSPSSADPTASAPTATDPVPVTSAPPSSSSVDPSNPVDGLFLTAEEMPGLNDQTVWTDAGTEPEGTTPFGDCAKFSLVDSGADAASVRNFTAAGSQRAAQLIATFADAKSAWRVEQVLRGWHRDCAKQLDADVEKVNPILPATVGTGKAFTYLLQFGKADAEEHHFNGVAVNRLGATISIVLIDNAGQDYNYDVGQEPAQQAARAVADKLG
ncbi:hypothetical protein [Nocardioides jensenii]|uniref:hypothetical protein n=1 Tax=Nocardioides jensenii TaxID=1843 RepID=UPI00082FB128|nr:hypothetical protein [Nocardioides jensenii]